MPRHLNLRQIEAFKAVIENGTVSRAAELLNISQPAMSKLISHLEMDTGLKLFERVKGRLAATEHAMRLHDEIGRIFAGVHQVENAVEAIRREEQGRLAIGVMPALSNSFIQRATTGFLKEQRNVYCSVQSLSSQWIVERLVARKLDVGLISDGYENPYIIREPVMEHPLVCILPKDHPLADKRLIKPKDLESIPFVGVNADTYIGHQIERMFDEYKVRPQIVLVTNISTAICEFVASGLGVSLVHPLNVSGLEHKLVVRRFEPDIMYNFQLCHGPDSRNAQLIKAFIQEVRATAAQISQTMLGEVRARQGSSRATSPDTHKRQRKR